MSNEKTLSLKERVKAFETNQLAFMDGRNKGDIKDLLDNVSTIDNYGFLMNAKNETYAVFTVSERPNDFFFGGMVLTLRLQELDADGYRNEIEKDGLPVLFTEEKSKKSKMTYVNAQFYPEI